MEMVSCHCTKGCLTQRCLCKSNQLACTDICGCIGCENKSNAEDATEAGSTLCDDGYDDDSEEEMWQRNVVDSHIKNNSPVLIFLLDEF